MDERIEEEESQHSVDQDTTEETLNSDSKTSQNDLNSDDSDDGMEIDTFEDAKSSDKGNDSELIDSDVNIEATELTSSDQDMSDESDLKGDVSSDMESNANFMKEHIKNDCNKPHDLESDEEETFELELKDGKEDSADEESDKADNETSRNVNDGNNAESKNPSAKTVTSEIEKIQKNIKTESIIDESSTDKENENSAQVLQKERTENTDDVCSTPKENIADDKEVKTEIDDMKNENEEKDSLPNASKENINITSNEEIEERFTISELAENELEKKNHSTIESNVVQKLDCCDSTDDLSDFSGFDTNIRNEALQIYQILQENHEELAKRMLNPEVKDINDSKMDIDEYTTSEPQVTTPYTTISGQVSPVNNDAVVEGLPQERRNSEEQISNNSKRIKKKRKFFDEFDDSEVEPPKRPHLAKEHENRSNIDNSLSENKENFMSAEKLSIKDETLSETSATSSALASSTPNPPRTETKGRFDISNPDFKEPFKYGWRREVVYRFISEDGRKRSADVSYFTPQGKKLRSIKQIKEHLPGDGSLHVRNFTFSKELVFPNRDSELEVTRFTKKIEMELLTNESEINDTVIDKKLGIEVAASEDQLKSDSAKKSAPKKKEVQNKSKSNVKNQSLLGSELSTTKSKSSKKPKNSDADVEESSNATPKLAMPKILLRGPNVNSNSTPKSVTSKPPAMKIKLGSSKSSNQKTVKKVSKPKSEKNSKSQKRDKSSGDLETSMLPSDWKTIDQRNSSPGSKAALNSSVSSGSKSNRGTPACSISCPLALGTIPTLQCTICLCLFHFQCCGLDADRAVNGYVCKNCRMCERKKENVQPTYKTVQRATHSPKRLYPADHYDSLAVSVNDTRSLLIPKNTKIVDGVTTWLPSSSNIRLKNSSSSLHNASSTSLDVQSPLVQGVLELDGRRYVVVPKQSILSVSPNASAMFIENHTECEKNAMNSVSLCDGTPNTLLVNPSDVNSTGVVLVPVAPANNAATSPRNFPSSRFLFATNATNNHVKFPVELNASSSCGMNVCHSINGGSPSEMNAYQSNSLALDYPSSFTLSNISLIYDPLLMSLKYLTVRDLLRISMTSKFLNRVASDPYLWKTVRLRNSQVHDWGGFAAALQKYGTKRLDMRKMLCSSAPDDLTTMWNSFLEVIPSITSLEHIDFSRAPTNIVDGMAATCANLSVINALYLRNGSLQLENFANMKHLTELRLKGVSGIQLDRSELGLQFINRDNLREISLTSVRNLDMDMLKMISEATNLVTLELGECTKLPPEFANDTITKLTKLEKLRLEKLQDLAPKYDIFEVIKDMSNLKYLELINIEVKEGFDDALGQCKNLEHFLIIPTYVSQSATTNQLIINGIKRLSDTIKSFVWGLTLELLKVTDLFMDQWQQKGNNSGAVKKGVGDSIPILKAVDKLPSDGDTVPTHVDILPVPKLEKMLITLLPNSRVKVIKIPFQMTWRQCLAECLK